MTASAKGDIVVETTVACVAHHPINMDHATISLRIREVPLI
jgi:hypothetical protein